MNQWLLPALLLVCIYVYTFFKNKYKYFKDLEVPYLSPSVIVGNMGPLVFHRKHRIEFYQEMYRKFPGAKYFGMFNFLNPTIFVKDLELIKSITIKNFDNFTDHKAFADEKVDKLLGKSIFNYKGDKWRETRNMLSPAFTSSKLKTMYELMIECSKNCVHHLDARSAEEASNNVVDMKDLFTRVANDITATTMFGISVNSLKDPENKFFVFGSQTANLNKSFRLKMILYKAFPRVMMAFNIKYSTDEVEAFFRNVIGNNVNMRDEKGIKRPDMLQALINARDKEDSYTKMVIEDMTGLAFSFYLGGLETTSTQMCILSHEIAINPDIQKKMQDEIDQVMKETNGEPTYEAINAMPYMDAVFNESMRRHTQATMIDRVCTKPFELPPALPGGKPIVIQPGTYIIIPVAEIHLDPKYYENPEKFDPERYYQKKVTINDVLNMGFGIGPRFCMGNRFATMEIKILFFYLLSRFRLEPLDKNLKEFKYTFKSSSISPESGYNLKIIPRTDVK